MRAVVRKPAASSEHAAHHHERRAVDTLSRARIGERAHCASHHAPSGQVALYTSAAGSSELRPAAKSSAESSASIPELRKMTIVEPLSAMVRMPSPAGMGCARKAA